MTDNKVELKIDNIDEMTPEIMAQLIDSFMEKGSSRLKIKESEQLEPGQLLKEYHHGRCDINSPWAKGQAFDVIE